MPDITMCMGRDCPKKEECYRYTAKPTPPPRGQSMAAWDDNDVECTGFWHMGWAETNQKLDEEGLL